MMSMKDQTKKVCMDGRKQSVIPKNLDKQAQSAVDKGMTDDCAGRHCPFKLILGSRVHSRTGSTFRRFSAVHLTRTVCGRRKLCREGCVLSFTCMYGLIDTWQVTLEPDLQLCPTYTEPSPASDSWWTLWPRCDRLLVARQTRNPEVQSSIPGTLYVRGYRVIWHCGGMRHYVYREHGIY